MNLCTRCGKVRIVVKTYKEIIGNSKVTCTDTSCPDPVCQAIVDKQLAKEKDVRLQAASFAIARGFRNKGR
ncbi:hypothetical protein A2627_01220 [Candidatus Woesebacteria bacterium RIFCSPHIGHO2_01_FULL_39_28]|uniref:Uncharacterized protein n=1 Tax=Candidatus Woesebacteria bacterium RIFCSPHIGHO2_01_FULL_39_28 TaxID=1802496 RepID=A0A1F7YJA5_9BACT|nr:MAG: hypothetical protein A2627_01220 [Candidatus Woesebacteria bacterium RIFCSPHIGHO2_01_FULL_39_28]OGM57676.1 MAG: hypothetical protein A3A50_01550 [Candidatus Woesebacteria bacterium RIFCSPLOWO2_01_FULL_38_20]